MSEDSSAPLPAPKASIVVPSRGGAKRLPVLLDALRLQDEKSFEIIVVLDGDIDGSRGLLEAEASTGDLDLTIIEFPENRGRVAALNAGFEAASGSVYVRCDDDFEPRPTYVSRRVRLHADGPVGVIGLAENVYEDNAYARAYGREAETRFHRDAYATAPGERWRYWAGNVSVDRETYARVGPYDGDFRAYGWEDVDWGYRLHEAGVPIVIDRELATPHHLVAVTLTSRARRAYQSGSAMRLFQAKHPQGLGPMTVPWTPWVVAVRCLAVLPPSACLAIARTVDRSLPRLPKAVSSRLVALVVEGAVLGGRWHSTYNDMSI